MEREIAMACRKAVEGPIFNLSLRKVGGIWFLRLGAFSMSFCISHKVS